MWYASSTPNGKVTIRFEFGTTHEKFTSPEAIKEKLRDTFTEYVPDNLEFKKIQSGGLKLWRTWRQCTVATLLMTTTPYGVMAVSNSGQAQKRKNPCDTVSSEPQNKRAKREDEIETTFRSLREKHSEKYSDPQLRLWARMHANGLHDNLDSPPNVPAITGEPTKRKRDEVLIGSQRPSTPPSSVRQSTGISPASKANLSGQYLQQLRTLQQLRENEALTEEEFQEKKLLLQNLTGLSM